MVAIIPFSILEFQAECNFIVFSLNVKRNWQTKRASQYLSPEEGEGWTIFFFWGGGGGGGGFVVGGGGGGGWRHSRRQRSTEGHLFL